jgi:hypothetical protein
VWRRTPPPAALTTQQDHQRTMELLGIKELRRGVNGSDPFSAQRRELRRRPRRIRIQRCPIPWF